MPKAIWNGAILAESDNTVMIEGNHYFPASSLNKDYFKPSTQTSVCPWKGLASYYDIEVNGQANPSAAWTYQSPKEAAKEIKDHVAFWKGIKVE